MSKVKITKYDEGPFVVQGDFKFVDSSGAAFNTDDTIAICRCSQSKTQPFCDGSHKTCGYKEATTAR